MGILAIYSVYISADCRLIKVEIEKHDLLHLFHDGALS